MIKQKILGYTMIAIPLVGFLTWVGLVSEWWVPFAAVGIVGMAAFFVAIGLCLIRSGSK